MKRPKRHQKRLITDQGGLPALATAVGVFALAAHGIAIDAESESERARAQRTGASLLFAEGGALLAQLTSECGVVRLSHVCNTGDFAVEVLDPYRLRDIVVQQVAARPGGVS